MDPSGFEQVCVLLNGKETCGFGKVTTEFSLNYLNDLIVKDEARRQVTSAKDWVPNYPPASPGLRSIPLPGEVGLLSTGIVRVCSINNPGRGTNVRDWRLVGDCGKDEAGRALGSCWLDTKTIDLKSTANRPSVLTELQERGIEIEKRRIGIPESELLKKEASEVIISDALKKFESQKNWKAYLELLIEYQKVIDLGVDPESVAKAMF